jgi:hypothetical protein
MSITGYGNLHILVPTYIPKMLHCTFLGVGGAPPPPPPSSSSTTMPNVYHYNTYVMMVYPIEDNKELTDSFDAED